MCSLPTQVLQQLWDTEDRAACSSSSGCGGASSSSSSSRSRGGGGGGGGSGVGCGTSSSSSRVERLVSLIGLEAALVAECEQAAGSSLVLAGGSATRWC